MKRSSMKQIGVVVFGGGLNARFYVDTHKAMGRAIVLCNGYAEIWA